MENNGYDLSRSWFDYCFENPEKVKPNHTSLYFFCVEHCNRLGWKEKFGLPTTMAKEAIGIKSYNTYINTLNDLVEFGFIKIIEKSKNQYSSNIIALSKYNKALDKALDKALIKHATKQSESTQQSIDSIIKQLTKNKEQLVYKHVQSLKKIISDFENGKTEEDEAKTVNKKEVEFKNSIEPFLPIYGRDMCNDFYRYWTEPNKSQTKLRFELQKTWDISRRLATWAKNDKNFNNGRKQQTGDNENLAKSVAAGIARAKYERGKHI